MPYPCQTQLQRIAGCNNRQNYELSFRSSGATRGGATEESINRINTGFFTEFILSHADRVYSSTPLTMTL